MRVLLYLITVITMGYGSNFLTGLDKLKSTNFKILQGKNVGLVINHTALDRDGNHIIELLALESNINVLKI